MFDSLKINRKSISTTIVDYIKDSIYQGKFQAGEKMPPERELAQMMNVSRNTIREAYKILAAQGYLTIRHGNGVFVTDAEGQIKNITAAFFVKNDQIAELFSIRKLLETHAVKCAVEHYRPQYGTELMNILDDAQSVLKSNESYEQLAVLDQKFHLALTRMSGNSVLLRIMMNLIDLLGEARTESIGIAGRAEKSLQEHRQIATAIVESDAALAQQYMLEHLESVERSIVYNKTNGEG